MLATVFYNRSSWHIFISDCIKPFLEKEAKSVNGWSISLGRKQGDHIKLVVRSEDSLIMERFREDAGLFLTNYPSEGKIIEYPLKGFFMDYPNNSIWLNNDHDFQAADEQKDITRARQQISLSIMQVLTSAEIGIEDLFTFTVYLHLGIIKAVYNDKGDVKAALKSVLQSAATAIYKREGAVYEKHLYELFESNEEVLAEIINDIWSGDSYDAELQWLEDWIWICKKYLVNKNFEQGFTTLSNLLYKHIGLTADKSLQFLLPLKLAELF